MTRVFLIALSIFPLSLFGQKVISVKFDQLEEKILAADAPLTVFNFWATWCGPCIKELPYFEEVNSTNEDVKVYLVSVDFPNQLDRVKGFVKKKALKTEVLHLNEKDPDAYMPKVSEEWTGAIPATLFVTDLGKVYFHEKAFTKEELIKSITTYLN